MEGEHSARARFRIAFVAEEGFDAGGFVKEGQHARRVRLDEVWKILGVMGRLLGGAIGHVGSVIRCPLDRAATALGAAVSGDLSVCWAASGGALCEQSTGF